jgi:WD40 repeat protein
MLASGDIDGGVTLWNLDLTVAGRRLGAHARAVTSLAFSPRGFLVSAGEDGTVIIWRTSEGPERLMHALIGHGDEVWAVAFGSEERLISGSKDGGVLLWDLAAPDAQPVPVPVAGRVHVVAFGPDGRPLIVTDRDGTMLFWDGGTSPPRSFDLGRALNSDFANVRLSPAGDALAYGRADGTVILWDLAANPPASRTITGHTAAVRSVIFSPDGTKLYSGDSNGTIRVWDREGKQAGSAPGAARAAITQLAASPAGEWIAAATDVQTVVVWDLWQQSVQYLPALGKPISSLAFYPRDRLLASADTGGSVQLWDVVEGRRIGPVLRDAEVAINQLAFGPDGMHLAGASDSHVVFLWDLDLYAWQQLACAIANRNLTIAEWQQYFGSEKPRATCSAFPVPGSAQ